MLHAFSIRELNLWAHRLHPEPSLLAVSLVFLGGSQSLPYCLASPGHLLMYTALSAGVHICGDAACHTGQQLLGMTVWECMAAT